MAGLPAPPVEQWRWESDVRDPSHQTIWGTPVVVQLTDDDGDGRVGPTDIPDVVFIAQATDFFEPSVLKVLDGRDGTTQLEITHPQLRSSLLAAGDLDGDGAVEILAGGGDELVVFRSDGTVVRSLFPPGPYRFRDPIAIADIDQDGQGDAYSGALAVSTDGSWRWAGSFNQGLALVLHGSLATEWIASSPGLELIAGATIYSATGGVLRHDADLPDGLNAVADLDGDGAPEIVLVSSVGTDTLTSEVRILDDRLNVLAGPVLLEEGVGVYVSGPVIANLDADSFREILIPTTGALTSLEYDGRNLNVEWVTPTYTYFSATGATAFDFDGDGAAEVIYRDEDSWMILEGSDGAVLHREPMPSGTVFEMPIVANIDDDPNAEILVPSLGPGPGVRGDLVAYEIPGSCTPRSLWNQQTYHVSNVEDDAAIPLVEVEPWTTHGTWQAQVGTCCQTEALTPIADVSICEGEEALLDASGLGLVGCAGSVTHEWSDASGIVGTGPVLRVSPSTTTAYLVTVRCDGDSECLGSDSVLVVVDRPPVVGGATVTDPSDCGLGLLIEWQAADFGGRGGRYHIYRSDGATASCADALSRPPLISDLLALSWTDRSTFDGVEYVYVIEAEADDAPTACTPAGPNGGSVARACMGPLAESGRFALPAGIGAVLRTSHDGDEVQFTWEAVRPLLAGEHFHLLKALRSADETFSLVSAEPLLDLEHVETDRSSRWQFFDLRTANPCEQQSEDEYPPG